MTILIVEDDPMVRSVIRSFINKLNTRMNLLEAGNVDQAKKIFEERQVDVLLLDVYLGHQYGPDLLSWIRKEEYKVDVILITADNSTETFEKAFHLGAIDYLLKPFSYTRFSEAMNKVLARKVQLRQSETMDQNRIDALLGESHGGSKAQAGKGYNTMTRELIIACLKKYQEPITSQLIAKETELARVTVRRYLQYMVEEETVREELIYGKVGRPQKCYEWIGDASDV